MRAVAWTLAVVTATALAPRGLQGQSTLLEQTDSLAAAGEADQARAALSEWWSARADSASRSDLQRGLWLRGLLTVDPRQAELDYQRLVVEYPGGPFTDAALLRLAQAERAEGRPERALAHLRTLVRDYPASPRRLRAQELLPDVEKEAAAAAAGDTAAATPAAPVQAAPPEVASPAAPGAPSRGEKGAPPKPPERPSAAAGRYAVQLGAFSTPDRARTLLQRATDAGLDPRLVRIPGSGLVRVRVGRFTSQDAADGRVAEIRAQGFDALLVSDADQEEVVP